MAKRIYVVPEIHCEHCVAAINRELGQIEGISDIQVDLKAKTVTLEQGLNVTTEQIAAGLYEAGFDLAKA